MGSEYHIFVLYKASEQDGVKQTENAAEPEDSSPEILVQFAHPHTLPTA